MAHPADASEANEVLLFPTCLVEAVRPHVVDAARRLLERRGFAPVVARFVGCCGQPAWNAGYASDARRVARRVLRTLHRTDAPIVVPSGSCAAMMRHHWPEMFGGTRDASRARAVAARVIELTALCATRARAAGARGHERGPIAYHASCHLLRTLEVREAPVEVLQASGYTVVHPDGADRCCGFGGTFAVKLPGISVAMADEKLDTIVATGATTVAGCDLSCLVHLEGRAQRRGLPLRFRHVAELCTDE